MKKTIRKIFMATCFTAGLALGTRAQLPSEKTLPVVLNKEVKQRMLQQPPRASSSLPSEANSPLQGVTKKAEVISNGNNPPIIPAADRQQKLPSNTKDPVIPIKRKPNNG